MHTSVTTALRTEVCFMELAIKPIERRARARVSVDLQAIIKVGGFAGLPCMVRNVSPMGALIVFDRPTIFPSTFRLIVPEKWFEAECEVRHRSPTRAGVVFTSHLREALARFS
jgi:hypothetical protein